MKVIFFIGSISGGGAERVTCNLANFLVRRGYDVTILTMSESENTYGIVEQVKIVNLINNKERKNFIFDNIVRYLRLGNFMNITSCDCYVVMLPITIILMLLHSNITKSHIIASERNNPDAYNFVIKLLLKILARRADAWVFQTNEEREWYGKLTKKWEVIPNAINPDFIKPIYQGEKNDEIVAVGRLNKQKNHGLLIEAFHKIALKYPSYILSIYGEGPEEMKLKKLVKDLNLLNRVFFRGYVEDISQHIQKSKIFVMGSDFEGMPNSLMEAMALGLPCISTDCPAGGPSYLIKNCENGILVPVGDVQSMTEAIEWMINNEQSAFEMGNKARKIVEELNPDVIYGKWEQMIRRVATSDLNG